MKLVIACNTRSSRTIAPALVRILLSCCYLLFCGGLGLAQKAGLSLEPNLKLGRPPSIRVNSDLVLIPVTVLDRDDRSVVGLEKERFRVFEDKVEQVITQFAMEDAPVSIGFAFDASASMRDKLQQSREAVTKLLNTANPGDEFFLVYFNDQVELAVDLTTSTQQLQEQLTFIQPSGRTALLDAIHFSLQRMHSANNVRKALIIISDGGDNSSRYTMTDLKKLVREADVQIYAIGIFDPINVRSQISEELAGPALLRRVAKQSGGLFFEIDNVNQLPDVAYKIGEALRTQYVLGYSPKEMQRDGKYHRVEVKLAQPKGFPQMQTSWRRGYRAPVE